MGPAVAPQSVHRYTWALRHAYACADRRTKLSLAFVEPLWAVAGRDGFGEEVGLVGATGEIVGFGQVD